MPKTRAQSIVFTAIMVFFMVYCMTLYSIVQKTGELTYAAFLMSAREMWIEYIIVFVLIFFVITKFAMHFAMRLFTPDKDKPIFITLAIQTFTVMQIVPVITLIVTFLHNGIRADWLTEWLTTAVGCFPAAFFLQLLFVGPFVRLIFRTIFRSERTESGR